jgi:myo-inositol-1(or 4)-monophosphatase
MRNFLKTISIQAGKIALDYKARLSTFKIDRKSKKELVTVADVTVEKYLIEQIKQMCPDHSIIGEESGIHDGNEYCWLIDPIDGTTSFVHNQPFFCNSVALKKNSEMILAAVNIPALGELFMAEKGKGATLNEKPIHVSSRNVLSESVLATDFGYKPHHNLSYFNKIVPIIRGVRQYGSAAINLAYVACGRFDGYWELNLNIYDMAAGMLILQEAGGKVTDFVGTFDNIPTELLGTNGHIHTELSEMLMRIKAQS